MRSVYADVSCWHTHTHANTHGTLEAPGIVKVKLGFYVVPFSMFLYFHIFFLNDNPLFLLFLFSFFFFRGWSHITFLCCALLRLSSQVGRLRTVIFVLYDSLETCFFLRCFLWKTSLSSLFFFFIFLSPSLPPSCALCSPLIGNAVYNSYTYIRQTEKLRIWLAVQGCRYIYI